MNRSIPAVIGNRLAENTNLAKNEVVIIRWRDKDGTIDATDIKVVPIMHSLVPSVDKG